MFYSCLNSKKAEISVCWISIFDICPTRIIPVHVRVYIQDDYRRNANQDQQLRSLAENHGRQMEYLQLRNRDLEKQRDGKIQISDIYRCKTRYVDDKWTNRPVSKIL